MPNMRQTSPGWKTPVIEHKPPPDTEYALYSAPRDKMIAFIESLKWKRVGETELWQDKNHNSQLTLRVAYTICKMTQGAKETK